MAASKIVIDEIKGKVADISCGLLASVTDLSLFAILSLLNISLSDSFKYSVSKVSRISTERTMDQLLALGINKEAIKRAFWKLAHRKLIKRSKATRKEFALTETGNERLKNTLPYYKTKRPWGGHLYLVTYDVPEELKKQREQLRNYLKNLYCGLLQDSVWLTPYDPKAVLKEFILEKGINGSVIVSDVGKEGSVGDEELDDLVARVFHLEELNEKYRIFIQRLKENKLPRSKLTRYPAKAGKFDSLSHSSPQNAGYSASRNKLNKIAATFEFLSILKDDPQLPFEILPYNWLGSKAYQYLQEYNPSV